MIARCARALALCLLWSGTASAQHEFPELEPAQKAPEGYAFVLKDGPDFYVWRLHEKVGDPPRSGFGIYFGMHPSLAHIDKKTAKEVKGTVYGQEATWWVQTSDDPKEPRFRRDARIDYRHGKEYETLALHVWIWGDTEERVAEVEGRLKTLSFRLREK